MGNIATFDLGTTQLKCVVLGEGNKVLFQNHREIKTYNDGTYIEQSPKEWYEAFTELSKAYFSEDGEDVDAIIMSGQMQDVILLDKNYNPLMNAILYNDQRGESEIVHISDEALSAIEKKTANKIDGTIPLPKLMWLKKHTPYIFEKTYKVLISSKDYIITRLTGECVSDVTSLSTAGMMDIIEKKYISELQECGIDKEILPKIAFCHEVAGVVSEKSSKETGFAVGTKVFVGSGDAGATTLASGISKRGELNINLGTSGWVASISSGVLKDVFNLSAINEGDYVNVVPVLNAGNVHKWAANTYGGGEDKYAKLHELLKKGNEGCGGIFFLPYVTGERFPVSDSKVRGTYVGISPTTTSADLALSTLEGVCYSLKQGLEALSIVPKKVSLIGGGALEKIWNQKIADILGSDVFVYENSEFLPSIALASSVKLARGEIASYEEFVEKLIDETVVTKYTYDKEKNALYEKNFKKFKKIYPAISEYYNG